MKILDGELQETQYNWPSSSSAGSNNNAACVEEAVADITESTSSTTHTDSKGQPLAISKNTVYHPNQVTYVHGKKFFPCPKNFWL